MRKLIMWNVISLDGYFEGEKAWDLEFHQTVFDKELQDFSIEQLQTADMLVFGSKTYAGMFSYWTSDEADGDPVTPFMNKLPKIVCSTKLGTADWQNSTIVKDAVVEIPKLKQEGNGNMFVLGSGNLSESLMQAGLFDEYRLCIAPVFLGKGSRLFNVGIPYEKLKLLKERRLQNGGVILMYAQLNDMKSNPRSA
jgi:dihydrofolate reductase